MKRRRLKGRERPRTNRDQSRKRRRVSVRRERDKTRKKRRDNERMKRDGNRKKGSRHTRRRLIGRVSDPRYPRIKTVVRRRYRRIYLALSPDGERVMVKVNTDVVEARRESKVMKVYGRNVHLVQLLKYYERGGMAFIIMEWIPGKTLSDLILRHGAFPPETVVKITLKILRGLTSLHGLGYVHGDLHTGNVIVRRLDAPKIKIIDMQMAVRKTWNGKARARRKLLKPPPQFAPESPKQWIDERYDLYSVGFMMACMLRGKLLRSPVRQFDFDDTTAPLWRVIKTAVNPDPSGRYRSADDMADAIRSAMRKMMRETS